jgi:signal transduction histidine kinase
MSAIASTWRRHALEIAWGVFALANVAIVAASGTWETIPFHFVWVSLTLLYWLRTWGPRTTAMVLAAVCAGTGAALLYAITHEPTGPGLDELAEVPLMAAMFLAMFWHARRRQIALNEVKRLAESEHRLLESQREFVRDASHTLRTPITIAHGHAELILASAGSEQVRQDAEIVLDELERMARLSERLLLLAASEHPNFLSRRPVEVKPFLLGIARRWKGAAQRDWVADLDANGTIVIDDERLANAIDALIENAVKYTVADDVIALRARNVGHDLVVEISDTGPGIPSTEIERVFDPFMRAKAAATARNGTGLGLAIVKAIVDSHGGSVDVQSPPDRGATFRLRIPGLRREPEPDRIARSDSFARP